MASSTNKQFTGSLIRKDQYQFNKRKLFFLVLLATAGPLLTFLPLPSVVILFLGTGIFLLAFFLFIQLIIHIRKSTLGKIELDRDTMRLYTSDTLNPETIDLSQVSRIEVQAKYDMPRDSLRKEWEEISGKRLPNLIRVKVNRDSEIKDVYFQADSYFQLNKLNHLIQDWRASGYPVALLEKETTS